MTLFVEDDKDTLSLYRIIARDEGVYASSLQEAYLQYALYNPDVIILDFNIKGEIPLDFIDYVRKDNPEVRIFIVTAYPVQVPLKYLRCSADNIYMKPLKVDFIKEMMHYTHSNTVN